MEDLFIFIMNFELYPLKEARYSYEIGAKDISETFRNGILTSEIFL